MWFGKWFGARRSTEETDDEPARFSAPQGVPPAAASSATTLPRKAQPASSKGFDPYNSGAFERRNAWERIKRR